MRRIAMAVMMAVLWLGGGRGLRAGDLPAVHPSIRKDAQGAIDLGLRWLQDNQHEDGHWSLAQFPAITALVAQACLNDPARKPMEVKPHVGRALAFIVSCARKDGGIYQDVPQARGGGLRNYNTAICMTALAASGDVRYDPMIRRARDFLAGMQCLKKGVYYGGFGYDAPLGRPYADMTNTGIAMEAFAFTRFVVDNSCAPPLASIRDRGKPDAGVACKDVDWQAAAAFLERCQNIPSAKSDKAVSGRPGDLGGFFYEPNRGMAGGGKDADGRPIWYSYGTATYGGLMSLLYADVDRGDRRVQAAIKWVRRNWTLAEHAGQGQQGLYFYYHTIAKALRAYGEDPLELADGARVNWRRDMVVRLCSLQRKDPKTGLGYWVNPNGRWMENDPVLVTAYSLLALEMLVADTAP